MDAIRRLSQSQKLISPKNSSHEPKDVVDGPMGTQLVKLNEVSH
jgi:hypothetical protein